MHVEPTTNLASSVEKELGMGGGSLNYYVVPYLINTTVSNKDDPW